VAESRVSAPRKVFLNGTIPAFVNRRVGSPSGTSEALATIRCFFASKKRRNASRISLELRAITPPTYRDYA